MFCIRCLAAFWPSREKRINERKKHHYSSQLLVLMREQDGEWNEVRGIAESQQPGKTDKLWVQFDNWFSRIAPGITKGEYWVLYHDPAYQFALVGRPNREYLWVLSRASEINGVNREQMPEIAQQQGYDTSKLIWRRADPTKP